MGIAYFLEACTVGSEAFRFAIIISIKVVGARSGRGSLGSREQASNATSIDKIRGSPNRILSTVDAIAVSPVEVGSIRTDAENVLVPIKKKNNDKHKIRGQRPNE